MAIVRWDAFRDLAAREEQLTRMLAGFYARPPGRPHPRRVGAGSRHLQQRPARAGVEGPASRPEGGGDQT